jgi:ABC-type transporter Mla maintaining outer membrane lipid asymmetry ATPase subunit MlaF
MRTVYDVANRVLLLHDGKIWFDGSPEEIKSVDDLVIQQFITGNSTLV